METYSLKMDLPCIDQEIDRFTVFWKGQPHSQLSVVDFLERLAAQLYRHLKGISVGEREQSNKNQKSLHFRNTFEGFQSKIEKIKLSSQLKPQNEKR